MRNILSCIIKYSIYVLVFMLPLFWLPFSFEPFEYNKQYLLFFLTSIALFAWLSRMVFCDKEIRFRRTSLDLFVLAFFAVVILSAIFSVDRTSSIFGFYGRFSDSLIGLLSLGILYFLITNNIGIKSEIRNPLDPKGTPQRVASETNSKSQIPISKILKLFLWSAGAVVLISCLSIFGIMFQRTFNPTAGSLEGLAIFFAVVAVLFAGLLFSTNKKLLFTVYCLLLMAIFLLLMIIDFTAAWIVVLTALVLFIGIGLKKRIFQKNINRLLIPMFLITIAGACIPLRPNLIFGVDSALANLPREQTLNQQTSWEIGLKTAKDSVKQGFLGSGVGTFHYNFAKEKPIEINQTWLWQIRFDRAGNHFAELLGTIGFLGLLSYLTLIGIFLLISWFFTANLKQLLLFPVFFALLVGQFVYYQNTTLAFVFWLVLGLSVVKWPQAKLAKERVISFKAFPGLALVSTFLTIVLGMAFMGAYFFSGKFYWADMNYARAQRMPLGDERTASLEKAVRLNPDILQYRLILARAYLDEALQEIMRPEEERDFAKLENRIAKAIREARRATILGPNQVVAWETLGVVYRELQRVAGGAVEHGIESFRKAIELEPINPVLYTEVGRLYMTIDEPEKAKSEFSKALEKKSDYPDALFQMGLLYFNDLQIDEAIAQFNRVISIFPDHSNALYALGIAHSIQGNETLAIQMFTRVLELNPGNVDVQQRLRELGVEVDNF